MTATLRISRQQLAKFLGNDHDAIRQFENLFKAVEPLAPPAGNVDIETAIETAIGSADAKAQSASDLIEGLAAAVERLEAEPHEPTATPTEEYLLSSIGLINAQLKHLQDQIDALQQGVQL